MAEPYLVVGQPSGVDPTRAPAGQHVLWIQVRTLPYRIRCDAAGKIAAGDWAAAKEAYADRVLDILERYAPGTRSKILARHVISPVDLEADVPNLVEGDSLAGSHHLDQNFLFKYRPSVAPVIALVSPDCIWSALRHGLAAERAPARVFFAPRNWPVVDEHIRASWLRLGCDGVCKNGKRNDALAVSFVM